MPELWLETPLGPITLVEEAGAITAIDWRESTANEKTPTLLRARAQLEEYFVGAREDFDLALAPHGTTFQRAVWAALREIPYGETRTYGQIAACVGGSARAIGQANGANPIPIIIPCHRVVAAGGIGGYSAPGGLATKRALLALETTETLDGDLFDEAQGMHATDARVTGNEAMA